MHTTTVALVVRENARYIIQDYQDVHGLERATPHPTVQLT